MKKIYTSYYGNRNLRNTDGDLFSVSRSSPKGMDIKNIKEFNPSYSLFKAYKYDNTISIDKFKELYLEELNKKDLSKIVEMLKDGDILLCYEKDEKVCHREVIKEYLNNTYKGILQVEELR